MPLYLKVVIGSVKYLIHASDESGLTVRGALTRLTELAFAQFLTRKKKIFYFMLSALNL